MMSNAKKPSVKGRLEEFKLLMASDQAVVPLPESPLNTGLAQAGDASKELKKLFGTEGVDLSKEIFTLGALGLSSSGIDNTKVLTQSLSDYQPNNPIEAKLVAQASVLFRQGMKLIDHANNAEVAPEAEQAMKWAVKCLRLHTETVLALDRLRRGHEQKVTVQHQHFNIGDSAQAAIVAGNFHVPKQI